MLAQTDLKFAELRNESEVLAARRRHIDVVIKITMPSLKDSLLI